MAGFLKRRLREAVQEPGPGRRLQLGSIYTTDFDERIL